MTKSGPGVIETKLRERARSKLKAALSEASRPLREMAGNAIGARGMRADIDKLEAALFQDLVDDAEANEITAFLATVNSVKELVADPPKLAAPRAARAS